MPGEQAFIHWEAKCCAELAKNGYVEFYKAFPLLGAPMRIQACRPLGAHRAEVVSLTREVSVADRDAPRSLRSLGITQRKWKTFGTLFRYLLKNGWRPDPNGIVSETDYHYTNFCFENDRLNYRGRVTNGSPRN
jgi:hypothetical protein